MSVFIVLSTSQMTFTNLSFEFFEQETFIRRVGGAVVMGGDNPITLVISMNKSSGPGRKDPGLLSVINLFS